MLLFVVSREAKPTHEKEVAVEIDSSAVVIGVLVTVAAAAGFAGLLVILLWGYHMFLICTGLTTKEHWKGTQGTAESLPGLGEELTVCARRGPRLFNPRVFVEAVKNVGVEDPGVRRKWMLRAALPKEHREAALQDV